MGSIETLPLRWKLALQTGLFAALMLVIFGVGVAWNLYRDGVGEIDRQFLEVSKGFFRELERRHYSVDWADRGEVDSLFPALTTLYQIEIVARGAVVYRSPNLGDHQFPQLSGRPAFASVFFGANRMRVSDLQKRDVSLRLAADMFSVDETWRDLLEAFFSAAPVVLLLVGYGAWWIAGRALRPVREITEAAQRISAQRLDYRLPLPGTRDEIERLTLVLNQMIDRLEAGFQQVTGFTADASHELKTPLTIIRGELEDALLHGPHHPTQEKLLLDLLEETTRLISITEGLLLLSRADAGKLQIQLTPLDLSRHLADLLEDVELLAERCNISLEAEIPPGVFVWANEQFLRQLLLNLFDNAIKYNERDGRVRVRVTPGPRLHTIAVANTGSGLSATQAARVFDRFFRGDASRAASISGHGLGLSISREIARSLDGEIAVRIDEPGWTEFCLTLRAAEMPKSAGAKDEA